MAQHLELKVRLPLPEGVTRTELKAYVRGAIESWSLGGDPDDPLFGAFRHNVTVTTLGPKRKAPTDYSPPFG